MENLKDLFKSKNEAAWKRTVKVGVGITTLVLSLNIGILIWATTSFPTGKTGATIVFSGKTVMSHVVGLRVLKFRI